MKENEDHAITPVHRLNSIQTGGSAMGGWGGGGEGVWPMRI